MEVIALLIGLAVAIGAIVIGIKVRRAARAAPGSATRPRTTNGRIDPFAVGEPWRQHVAAVLSAQRRFSSIVAGLADGPLRVRMAEIGRQVDHSVDECWQIAQRGDQLDGTIRQLDGARLQSDYDRSTTDAQRTSLRSQLDSVDRIRAARNETDQRLRDLHVRLGELVTQAAEVSTGVDHTAELGSAVEDVVVQLEALNQAVDEINNTGRSKSFGVGGPGEAAPTT
ncbi:MAG: hypothetical protein HZB15_17145 [Actinobacteria bacterium]|nr:hypothetical protein [Actinomycetota bacterium]